MTTVELSDQELEDVREAMTGKFPDDYEACAECGFDHTYEPVEAAQGHIY